MSKQNDQLQELRQRLESMQEMLLSEGLPEVLDPRLLVRWVRICLANLRKANAYIRDGEKQKLPASSLLHWQSIKTHSLNLLGELVISQLPSFLADWELDPYSRSALIELVSSATQAIYEEQRIDAIASLSLLTPAELIPETEIRALLAIARGEYLSGQQEAN